MSPDRFPGIKRAALAIAYDNGGINCARSEKRMLGDLGRFLDRQPEEILPPINAWLSSLPEPDLQIVCCGDLDESSVILDGAPPFTDRLLTDYFNEVC